MKHAVWALPGLILNGVILTCAITATLLVKADVEYPWTLLIISISSLTSVAYTILLILFNFRAERIRNGVAVAFALGLNGAAAMVAFKAMKWENVIDVFKSGEVNKSFLIMTGVVLGGILAAIIPPNLVGRARMRPLVFPLHFLTLRRDMSRDDSRAVKMLRKKFQEHGSPYVRRNHPTRQPFEFGDELQQGLTDLKNECLPGDFMVIDKFAQWSPVGRSLSPFRRWREKMFRDDTKGASSGWFPTILAFKVATLADSLGGVIRAKIAGQEDWIQDFRGDIELVKNLMDDGNDLPLRYRTMVPELSMPSKGGETESAAPRFAIFTCIRNNGGSPLAILNVDDAINCIDEAIEEFETETGMTSEQVLKLIKGGDLERFGTWNKDTLTTDTKAGARVGPVPVLKSHTCADGSVRWWISWDVNRVVLPPASQVTASEYRMALSIFLDAVRLAEAAGHATIIKIKPGQVVIVDNQRCLVRRFEPKRGGMRGKMNFNWWLRVYWVFEPHEPEVTSIDD